MKNEEKGFLAAIIEMLKNLMAFIVEGMKKDSVVIDVIYIAKMPEFGDTGGHVFTYQAALRKQGYKIDMIDTFGPQTKAATSAFQKSKGLSGSGKPGPKTLKFLGLAVKKSDSPVTPSGDTPWMDEIAKDLGKHESDPALQKKLVPFWKKTGLNYTSLVGSRNAWCGLAVAAYLIMGGVQIDPSGYYRARNLDNLGVAIDYKTYGIPYGAVITLNNKGNCNLGNSNHTTFSKSECTPKTC